MQNRFYLFFLRSYAICIFFLDNIESICEGMDLFKNMFIAGCIVNPQSFAPYHWEMVAKNTLKNAWENTEFLFKIYFHYNCSNCNIPLPCTRKKTLNHIYKHREILFSKCMHCQTATSSTKLLPANKSQTVLVLPQIFYTDDISLLTKYKMAFNNQNVLWDCFYVYNKVKI